MTEFLTGNEIEIGENEYTLYYTSNFDYTTESEAVYLLNINYESELSPIVVCKYKSTDKNIFVFEVLSFKKYFVRSSIKMSIVMLSMMTYST